MWTFPEDVEGWLTEEEGLALAELATGRDVLEIGSYCGKSTICMAQTANSVTCVDPFDGRATSKPGPTLDRFRSNIGRYRGVKRKIRNVRVGRSAEILPRMEGGFHLAFIDGAHDKTSVLEDARLAGQLLRKDGLLAFHDYHGIDPGVDAAVDHLRAEGAELVSTHGSVAVLRPVPPGRPKAMFLGVPSYDGRLEGNTAMAAYNGNSKERHVVVCRFASSALCMGFNYLWCEALNSRISHRIEFFAMLHADIEPEMYWLDKLLKVLDETGADVVSAVAPIKDDQGVSSTAIDDPNDPWHPLYRLTMKEVADLPEVFTAADCGHPDTALLVNTGCWLCRVNGGWAEQFAMEQGSDGQSGFNTADRIVQGENGRFTPEFQPEDWRFSRWLHQQGLKVAATKTVRLHHVGNYRVPNHLVWGHEQDPRSSLKRRQTTEV